MTVEDDIPGGSRILVIEDNAILAEELLSICEDLGAAPLQPAATLAEVQGTLEAGPVDAATVDLNLGDGLRFDVADFLALAGIPFVFVSGYDAGEVPARHAGVPFLQKPVRSDVLGRALRACIRVMTPRHDRGDIVTSGDSAVAAAG